MSFHSIDVSEKTFESIRQITLATNQTKKEFLDELIEALDDIFSQYYGLKGNKVTILYSASFINSQLFINLVSKKKNLDYGVRAPTQEDLERDKG